jgi:hypothetical protein
MCCLILQIEFGEVIMDAKPDGVMDDEVDIEDCGNDSSVV